MLIEIAFIASQFQCGSDAPLATFQATYEGTTIELNQTILIDAPSAQHFYDNVSIVPVSDASCAMSQPVSDIATSTTIPQIDGAYNQASLDDLAAQLTNPYLYLFLYEFGTTNESASTFDLQDVVLRVNTNPTIFAD